MSADPHPGWIKAVARYRARSASFEAANTAADQAQGKLYQRQPDRPTFVMEVEGDYGQFGRHTLPITISHADLDDPARQWADPERIDAMRRDLAAYRETLEAVRRDLNLDRLERTAQVTLARQSAALRDLIVTPVPDMAALAEKASILLDEYGDEGGGKSALLADVRRLAGAA